MKNSILETIGNTPLIKMEEADLKANIYAKIEMFNPSGSIKIRIAKQMIDDALESGLINHETTLLEATSGNTGIGLALIAAIYKMKFICVMPSSMSIERRSLMKAYGATIILTDKKDGMRGSISRIHELQQQIKNSYFLSQFENPSNVRAHYLTTGPEIERDCSNVDILVCGIGTGGTISGVGKYLKERNPQIKIIGVEPANSNVLNAEGKAGPHKIQGIGAGFIPKILDLSLLNEVIDITDEEALESARYLAINHGLFVGISSGAAYAASLKIARRKENQGLNIVTIFPDGGERYLSNQIVGD